MNKLIDPWQSIRMPLNGRVSCYDCSVCLWPFRYSFSKAWKRTEPSTTESVSFGRWRTWNGWQDLQKEFACRYAVIHSFSIVFLHLPSLCQSEISSFTSPISKNNARLISQKGFGVSFHQASSPANLRVWCEKCEALVENLLPLVNPSCVIPACSCQ